MFQCQFVITEKCNLACKYCYMQNKQSEMSSDTFHNSLSFITDNLKAKMIGGSSPTIQSSSLISFFGGEPLLNYKLLQDVVPKYLSEKPKSMPTNGLLLNEERYKFLSDNNISISISFDGPYGNHYNRVLKTDNDSSFSFYNDFHFNLMKKHGCKVMLFPNLFEHMVETYNYFFNLGIYHADFSLVRDDIYTEKDILVYDENLAELTKKVITNVNNNVIAIPGILSLYILDTICYSKFKKRPFGCFAGTHGVGIMPNGKIYPCARFGSNDKFEIADINTGIINYDILEFLKENHNPQQFKKCLNCKLYNICNAGCSYSQLKNGNWNNMEPVESVCELLRISYKYAFQLFKSCKNNPQFINYLNHRLSNSK